MQANTIEKVVELSELRIASKLYASRRNNSLITTLDNSVMSCELAAQDWPKLDVNQTGNGLRNAIVLLLFTDSVKLTRAESNQGPNSVWSGSIEIGWV